MSKMQDPMLHPLIAKLEAATEGSRELDLEAHKVVGLCDPTAEYVSTIEGLRWFEHHPEVPGGADECIEEPLPYYTTSLDAKLPEENIIDSRRLTGHRVSVPDTWWARHETQNGSIVQGYGHTEVLARRIAALEAKELS